MASLEFLEFPRLCFFIIITTSLMTISIAVPAPAAPAAGNAGARPSGICHGQICSVEQYCSQFKESCQPCAAICDPSHNYTPDECSKQCPDYVMYNPLRAELDMVKARVTVTLILVAVLCAIFFIRYAYKCVRWLRQKGCVVHLLKKMRLGARQSSQQQNNNNDIITAGATISNEMAINGVERAPSQIYSLAAPEGSVMTMTTPVSTRYPAENTTPTTQGTEYSYDNQALAITPVSDKPSGTHAF